MRIVVALGPLCLSFRGALNLATCRADPIGMSGTDYATLRIAECLRDLGHSVTLRTVSAEAGTTWNGIEVIGPNDPMDRATLHVGSGVVESPKHALYHHNPEQIFHRYWLSGYPIMVGGSVLSPEDWAHLSKDYGLQRCINVETEHSDRGKVPDDVLCEAQVHDDGSPFRPEAIGEVIDFARRFPVTERLYVHCQMGGSRSPGFAYAILRGKYGLSGPNALAVINGGFPHAPGNEYGYHPVHQSYIASVNAWIDANPRAAMSAESSGKVDAVIAINEPDELRAAPPGAFRLCYALLNDMSFMKRGVADYVDLWVSPSEAHRQQALTNPAWHRIEVTPDHPNGAETYVPNPEKWAVVPLGCDPENFFGDGGPAGDDVSQVWGAKIPGRVVYCSSPDRGLHWLLQEWPAIRAAVPHATLHVFYRLEPWLRGWDATPHFPPIEPLRSRALYIEECLRRFKAAGGMGVTVRDSVSRDVIEREMASAEVLSYPCQTTTWSEGFSCTILECCAARACPVITDCDALGEVYASIDPVPMRNHAIDRVGSPDKWEPSHVVGPTNREPSDWETTDNGYFGVPPADHPPLKQSRVVTWQEVWREKVIRALTDTEWRNEQNENARKLAEGLSWKRTAEELCKVIASRAPTLGRSDGDAS